MGNTQNRRGIEPRTPLFSAINSERYVRQALIEEYEQLTGARLIVLIDTIFPEGVTYLEELLHDIPGDGPLHMMLASPGGDGETAIRMIRLLQGRCSELTVIVPDMAKSAATLICLGADRILMGPAGDLGPVDAQFQLGERDLIGAKEIVAAVDEAEERVKQAPDTFPLFSGLLADINMLIVEQARSAMDRDEALIREALACTKGRSSAKVNKLVERLAGPLVKESKSHSAVFSVEEARKLGLPAVAAHVQAREWQVVWQLWTRYFVLGCFPRGLVAVYEARRASQVLKPVR